MEVVWDLDTVAVGHARELGLPAARAGTPGTDPRFVAMVRELVLERVGLAPARAL
jgi:ferrochelatase